MSYDNKIPDIDFFRIRTSNNSKNKGFEELTVQLFRSSFPEQTSFYRVDDANGDGGVEDIALLPGNKKVGLQAKYFKELDSSQWTQINKSVKTALKTHSPNLVEYRIATPVNRSKNTQTWSNYIKKWNKYAADLGYAFKVKYVWQGETELRIELLKETNKSKIYYWFGCPSFSHDWLKTKYESCKSLLNIRYTPQHHVRTDSEQILDAFFLTHGFTNTFIKKWKKLILVCQESIKSNQETSLESEINDLNTNIESLKSVPQDIVPLYSKIEAFLKKIEEQIYNLQSSYLKLRSEKESEKNISDHQYHSRPFSYELIKIDNALEEIYDIYRFIRKYGGYDKQMSLVTGEAGTGKSHLLANSIERALEKKQPCLLLAGEQFQTGIPPLEQLCQILGWEQGVEALLGVLDSEASICGKPAVIAIDALNESNERKLWKSHLISVAEAISKYPKIKLLVSCRSDFEPFILPDILSEHRDDKWGYIDHVGFGSEVFEAVETYFNGYSIKCSHFPPLLEEFKNPLFLITFCEAYQGKTIPSGTLSFDTVMKERIKHCQKKITNDIDCPPYKTKEALDLIALKIKENNGCAIQHDSVRPMIDSLFDGGGESKSLYMHLRSNGMIVETLQRNDSNNETPEIMVRFPYERFSDYFIASRLLNTFKSLDDLTKEWTEKGLPDNWVVDYQSYWSNRGLLRIMAILIPERFGCEFIKLFKQSSDTSDYLKDFLDSLPWRTAASINTVTEDIFTKCSDVLPIEEFLSAYLRLLTIPDHPFNSLKLHEKLKSMSLHERELFWTIPISKITSSNTGNSVDDIISWTFKVSDSLVSEEQAWLAAIFLTWLLTTNYKLLRKRATLALIRILKDRDILAIRLINEFHDCNDPYVVERAYAAACGVALRCKNQNSLKELSQVVFDKMFSGNFVPTHILQRDYAQLIMERAFFLKAIPGNIDISKCRPRFNSEWPHIITENEAVALEDRDGWYYIKSSLQPESSFHYGDFGRYVMDASIHNFSSQNGKNVYVKKEGFSNLFQGMIARRYILGRIDQLGWTPEYFGEYEQRLVHGRQGADVEENKVERVSKKYQWIGLHELLGSLSDHYWMMSGYGQEKPQEFAGAWQLIIRDFDPSQPLIDPLDNLDVEGDNEKIPDEATEVSWHAYPIPFSDNKLRVNRDAWVSKSPEDFQVIIEINKLPDMCGKWLTLYSHLHWSENLLISQDESKEGRLEMWANLRCWLVKKESKNAFLKYINNIKFYNNGLDSPGPDGWIGEYPWASSCKNIEEYFKGDNWLRNCPIELIRTNGVIHCAGFNASLPSPIILNLLKLSWAGKDYSYIDSHGDILAFSQNYNSEISPLFVNREKFLDFTNNAGYVPLWAILCERSCYSSQASRSIVKKWAITQRVYGYEKMRLKCYQDKYDEIPLNG